MVLGLILKSKETIHSFDLKKKHDNFSHHILLILDEYDAFPYANNEVLQAFLKNSIKGNYVYMSATLLKTPDLSMTKRYHGYPLDIPKCYISNTLLMYIIAIKLILKFKKENKRTNNSTIYITDLSQLTALFHCLGYQNHVM